MRQSALLFIALMMHVSMHSQKADSIFISNIYRETLANGECYDHLRVLCKEVGHRLAGSAAADSAVAWGVRTMRGYSLDSIYTMPVDVPHWVRGKKEIGFYEVEGLRKNLDIVALGGSAGTLNEVKAEVIEVKSIAELQAMEFSQVEGKIVFFNKAMDPMLINTGAAYGGAYDIRGQGPSEAAKKGAVGCLIRSLTLADDKFAHTGATNYEAGVKQIPAAALSSVDARELSKQLKIFPGLKFTLHLTCENYPRKIQYNVIGEIRGSQYPEKVIVVGGHLDSWDVGEGAHDDGTGVTQSIEVLRILLALGYKPRHTIRAVLYMNEEFGNDGGKTYAKVVAEKNEEHIAAIESDGGGLTPLGFNVQGDESDLLELKSWGLLLEPYQLFSFRQGWSGVDIGPLKTDTNVLYGLSVDSQRYFDFHHSNNDVFENVNKREHILGAAAMASLVYLIDQK
ncbi:MAG: M28 family peptidase [Flavobacteriales bacterium]|jgi:carboxypeptidase Q